METRDEHDTSCPGDDELVAFACAENDSAELATHLKQCESCADHVRTLKEMRQAVRELKSGGPESITRKGILEVDESEPLTSGTSPRCFSSGRARCSRSGRPRSGVTRRAGRRP